MASSYWVCIVTRDGGKTIGPTLDSIIDQSFPPDFIVVVNDGSSDDTEEIVRSKSTSFSSIFVVNTNSKTRDIRRVPQLLNKGIQFSKGLPETRYMMVSGDDNELEHKYAETMMQRMDKDDKIAVASGGWISSRGRANQMPHGAGRFVRISFMEKIGGSYPVTYGWEPWLLYKALELGYEVRLYSDLRYNHLRPYNPTNLFGWGRAMYSLGFPLYFVLLRFLINLLWPGRGTQSRKSSITMMVGYFSIRLNKQSARGMIIEDEKLKKFVKRYSMSRLSSIFY